MIKSLVIVSSILILANCSNSNEKVWNPTYKKYSQNTLGDDSIGIGKTLPPSNYKCKVIEYMNQSTTNVLNITSIYQNHFKIEIDRMKTESANLPKDVVEGRCKGIADNQGLKFGFEYDASRETCMCAYGEKR